MMLSDPYAESAAALELSDALEAPDASAGADASGEGPAYTFEGFEIDSSVRIMVTPLGGTPAAPVIAARPR